MSKEKEKATVKSEERRHFLHLAGTAGFTTAVLAAAGGTLMSSEASAQTAQEEKEREAAAKHVVTLATEYAIGTTRSYPMMQLDLKENMQNATNGQVYVKLAPAGQLGIGSALAQKVQSGTVQAGQFSLSNFAPYAPAVDLINIPYFCGANQRFVNLVTSDVWKQQVNTKVEERGFRPLLYFCIDPRVVAVRKGAGKPVIVPAHGGRQIPRAGSKMLQQFYRLVGANPTPVAWGETPSAIKQGVADALDPSVGALYAFGFKDILSHVTFNQPVPDSQCYACNLEWFKTLSSDVQEAIAPLQESLTQLHEDSMRQVAEVCSRLQVSLAEQKDSLCPLVDQWSCKATWSSSHRPCYDCSRTCRPTCVTSGSTWRNSNI
ncbi:MAG: TRAP transporter substrate-binding protein [Rhodomicrobium sp.]|nr:TRAP transporter substrate-binding protein [Rhodomicrobium sp.]